MTHRLVHVLSVSTLVIAGGAIPFVHRALAQAPPANPQRSVAAAAPAKARERNDVHLNPSLVVGHQACEKCHAAEVATWKRTPHATTFDQLHQKKEAVEIAKKMRLTSIKRGQICIECHYTPQGIGDQVKPIAGVSCESCHAPAKNWVDIHADYGGPTATKASETPAHREQREDQSIARGMRNPTNVYLVAQSCYRCHTVPDEKLVNVGGHKAGTVEFEFVAWSQGMVRHNFLASNGKVNAVSDKNRLSVMFVAGMIADLEFSLRATAEATEKLPYGITSAQRADRAIKRLAEIQTKINNEQVAAILQAVGAVKLKLNNKKELTSVADQVAALGTKFADENDGSKLAAVQPFLPPPNKLKN